MPLYCTWFVRLSSPATTSPLVLQARGGGEYDISPWSDLMGLSLEHWQPVIKNHIGIQGYHQQSNYYHIWGISIHKQAILGYLGYQDFDPTILLMPQALGELILLPQVMLTSRTSITACWLVRVATLQRLNCLGTGWNVLATGAFGNANNWMEGWSDWNFPPSPAEKVFPARAPCCPSSSWSSSTVTSLLRASSATPGSGRDHLQATSARRHGGLRQRTSIVMIVDVGDKENL